jgi:hypothetical protein
LRREIEIATKVEIALAFTDRKEIAELRPDRINL